MIACVAQLVVQLIRNEQVAGSSPVTSFLYNAFPVWECVFSCNIGILSIGRNLNNQERLIDMIEKTPRIACINDISGFGRCSLTTAISVISSAGVQVCPVPTAILSKHTGFPQFYFSDFTKQLPDYLKDWDGLTFDGIYSGFLGSELQIETVSDFMEKMLNSENPLKIIIDTVIGDNGKPYPTYTPEMCSRMKELIRYADVITPNLTETAILTGTEYRGESIPLDDAKKSAEELCKMGAKSVVITGIADGEFLVNLSFENGVFSADRIHRTAQIFSGTGDLFASVLSACEMRGIKLSRSVSIAGKFISDATLHTLNIGADIKNGVVFEPFLWSLGREISALIP